MFVRSPKAPACDMSVNFFHQNCPCDLPDLRKNQQRETLLRHVDRNLSHLDSSDPISPKLCIWFLSSNIHTIPFAQCLNYERLVMSYIQKNYKSTWNACHLESSHMYGNVVRSVRHPWCIVCKLSRPCDIPSYWFVHRCSYIALL